MEEVAKRQCKQVQDGLVWLSFWRSLSIAIISIEFLKDEVKESSRDWGRFREIRDQRGGFVCGSRGGGG